MSDKAENSFVRYTNIFFSMSVTDIVESIEANVADGWVTVKLTNNMRNSRRIVELGSQLTGNVANPFMIF